MAQKPIFPKPNTNTPTFNAKTITPPASYNYENGKKTYDQKMDEIYKYSFDNTTKQLVLPKVRSGNFQQAAVPARNLNLIQRGANKPTDPAMDFHLTKDINASLVGSYPFNSNVNSANEFAVLNDVSYFSADDGINGRELWRTDGTATGTFMVIDINPGSTSADVNYIKEANGLLYFAATTADGGTEPWVSDGTALGTHLLKDINVGPESSYPTQYLNVNGAIYFVANVFSQNNQLWKTDGTDAGTAMVIDISQVGIGYSIFELTAVNDMVFFIASTYISGYQLFKSDGTFNGTGIVKEIGINYFDYTAPMQLTAYDDLLYFSADDGGGRRLWTSDGTDVGTHFAAGFNDVFIQQDYVSIYNNTPFWILDNVLYIAGFTYLDGSGLYKYDAANNDGIVLVKDLTMLPDYVFVVPVDMRVAGDVLYFKVISYTGVIHDEIWSSQGDASNTQPVKVFQPGNQTFNFYNIGTTLYFVNLDSLYGGELWKSDGTDAGTVLVIDINPGIPGSFPQNLTLFDNKLLFSAYNINTGRELWTSDGTGTGTAIVKSINSVNTESSDAGFFYKGICTSGDGVVFNAYTPALGGELYKSDGTVAGTKLLNDINAGPNWSYPNSFIFKNNKNYFIGDNSSGTALYKTNGTKAGLQKITAYIDPVIYHVTNINITDKGHPFYILANHTTGAFELWYSNGTDAGSIMLGQNLNYDSYVITVGNVAYFVAGDADHGYELWKSNGTVNGTKMIKDINPGFSGSNPYSLFGFKDELYFGAHDGTGLNYSLWKSDGTSKGTVELKKITPAYFTFPNSIDVQVFCISGNNLFFTATDFNTYGAELWQTNGTRAGTKMVKDINIFAHSFPNNLTNVSGTLYFTADDGVHGYELWSSDGTKRGTKLVKDITPDFGSTSIHTLCSIGGRLYFLSDQTFPTTIWTSGGNASNTYQVIDDGLTGLFYISNLTAGGSNLFFSAYSPRYGRELFVGEPGASALTVSRVNTLEQLSTKTAKSFETFVYPNPSRGNAVLQLRGETRSVTITIADMSGKTIWTNKFNNKLSINLPVEKLSAGIYLVTVKGEKESTTVRLLKQ